MAAPKSLCGQQGWGGCGCGGPAPTPVMLGRFPDSYMSAAGTVEGCASCMAAGWSPASHLRSKAAAPRFQSLSKSVGVKPRRG